MRIDVTKFEIALRQQGGGRAFNLFQYLVEKSTSLERLNAVVNTQIPYGSDQLIHRQKDYWAPPSETIAKGGDCEDFTFLKDFLSKFRGLAEPHQNRCMYCTWFNPRLAGSPGVKHMVLAHQPRDAEELLILDNTTDVVIPVTQRQDLKPAFSFTAENVYIDNQVKDLKSVRMSKWERYRARCAAEGIYF